MRKDDFFKTQFSFSVSFAFEGFRMGRGMRTGFAGCGELERVL